MLNVFFFQLLQAMAHFSQHGRGSAMAEYADRLAADCNGHWRAGRQLCEEISLTGKNCSNRKHLVHGASGAAAAAMAAVSQKRTGSNKK